MQNFYEYIGDYVNGLLNDEQKSAFESAMADDKGLRQAVKDFDVADMVLEGLLEEEIRGVLEEDASKVVQADPIFQKKAIKLPRASSMTPLRFIAATAAVLLAVLAFTKLMEDKVKPVEYADLHVPTTWDIQRGGEDDLSTALVLFQNRNEKLAKQKLRSINSIDARFYLSEIFFNEQEGDSILYYLPEDNKMRIKRDRVNYLEIMAYYFKKDKEAVKAKLNELPNDTDTFYKAKYEMLR